MNGGLIFIVYHVHPICSVEVLGEPFQVLCEFLVEGNIACGWTSMKSDLHPIQKEMGRDATLRYVQQFAQEDS